MAVNHVLEEKPNQELVQNNPALVRITCQVIIPGLIGMEIKLRAKIGQMTTLSTPVTVTIVGIPFILTAKVFHPRTSSLESAAVNLARTSVCKSSV